MSTTNPAPWSNWRETKKALEETYYQRGMTPQDQGYALAGLTRFARAWHELHGHNETPLCVLDAAAAHEIWYHYYRARQFNRAVAALSACWVKLVTERPERILDRQARMIAAQAKRNK